jgi:hypothetical protein
MYLIAITTIFLYVYREFVAPDQKAVSIIHPWQFCRWFDSALFFSFHALILLSLGLILLNTLKFIIARKVQESYSCVPLSLMPKVPTEVNNNKQVSEINQLPVEVVAHLSQFLSKQDCLSLCISGVHKQFSALQSDKR